MPATVIVVLVAQGEPVSHNSYSPPPYEMPLERVFSPKDGRWVFDTSKFCRATGKCVDDFDHYCLWLNNSIGAANYTPFLYALGGASLLVFMQTLLCLAQIILWGVDSEYFSEHAGDTVLTSDTDLGIVLCVFLLLLVIGLGFLFQLLFFHVYLIYNGITTYEFVADRERMRAVEAQGLRGVQPRFMVGTPASRRERRAKIRAEHAAFAAQRLRIRAAVWADIQAAIHEKGGSDAKEQQRMVRELAPIAYARHCKAAANSEQQAGDGATAPGIEMPPAVVRGVEGGSAGGAGGSHARIQSTESALSTVGSATAAKHLPGRGAVAPTTSSEAEVNGGLPSGWASPQGSDEAPSEAEGEDGGVSGVPSDEDSKDELPAGVPGGESTPSVSVPATFSAVEVGVASQSSGVLEGGPDVSHDSSGSGGDSSSQSSEGGQGGIEHDGGEGGLESSGENEGTGGNTPGTGSSIHHEGSESPGGGVSQPAAVVDGSGIVDDTSAEEEAEHGAEQT